MVGPAAVRIDLVDGIDVLDRKVQEAIFALLRRRRRGRSVVRGVFAALPCESFSRARRAPVNSRMPRRLRSNEQVMGISGLCEADLQVLRRGNQLILFLVKVLKLCERRGIPWAVENPRTSFC